MTDSLELLEKRIGETARSRFIASARLSRRDQRVSAIVAMASAYAITLTVMPYFVRLPTDVADLLNLSTVGLSIITLVSSLIVSSRRDGINSEQHHRSALELNELRREISIFKLQIQSSPLNDQDVRKLNDRYSQVLQKYSINHEQEDYDALKLERPHDYMWLKPCDRLKLWISVKWKTNQPTLIMIILTVAVIWMVFYYALPQRLPRP